MYQLFGRVAWGTLLLAISFGLRSFGATPIVELSGPNTFFFASDSFSYFVDTTAALDIDSVVQLSTKEGFFKVNHSKKGNFGYTEHAVWAKIKIKVVNDSSRYVLAAENTTLNFLDYYVLDDKNKLLRHVATGNSLPFSTRELDSRFYVFHLPHEKNKTFTVLVRARSEDALDFAFTISSMEQYFKTQTNIQIIEGLFFGGILIMAFYNFFLFLAILDVSYLYYVLYILSTLFFQMELGGWFNQYFMRDYPLISNKMGTVFFGALIFFIVQFLESFIDKRKLHTWIKNCFYITKVVGIIEMATGIFIPLKYNLPFLVFFALIVLVPTILVTIFYSYKRGIKSTRYLLVGWSSISLGAVFYSVASLGITSFNFLSIYGIQIGTVLEMLFLSFALADRINILRAEKQIAQRETINQLQENAMLLQRLNDEQKKAFGMVIQGEENERRRLAFELHDGLGQLLSVVKLNLSSLEQWIDKKNKQTTDMLNGIISLVDDSCREVRNISHNLMPNTVLQFGLMAALKDFCRKINRAEKIKLHFQNQDLNININPQIQTTLYRVIQEIVSNAIKHSQASDVYIQLFLEDNNLVILIEDNGKGFDLNTVMNSEKGLGIKNIISRIEYIKGKIIIDSFVGKGTNYYITLDTLQNNETE